MGRRIGVSENTVAAGNSTNAKARHSIGLAAQPCTREPGDLQGGGNVTLRVPSRSSSDSCTRIRCSIIQCFNIKKMNSVFVFCVTAGSRAPTAGPDDAELVVR